MEYTLTVKLKEVKESIVNTEIKESKIYMKNTDKFIEIELEEDKPKSSNDLIEEAYIDISNIFKEIKIDKKSSDISNLKELIAKWESVKKKIVFNTDSDMLVNFIINISKYYENEKSLEFLLKNFGIIPFFTLINFEDLSSNNDEVKKLSIYNIIASNPIIYKVKLKYNEEVNGEKKIEFLGSTAPEFDMIEMKKILKEELGISSDKTFTLSSAITGKYLFKDNLESLEVVLKLDGGKYFNKEYIISLEKI